jgi:hypothetical protein
MATRYAADTEVPVDRSKQQIEAMLRQRGATEYATGWDEGHDRIQFTLTGSRIRFTLPRPRRGDFIHDRQGRVRGQGAIDNAMAQADRQRWRALYLVIRAKLEAVDAGISILEQEFLAVVVTPNDLTVGDILVPRLQGGQQLMLGDGVR